MKRGFSYVRIIALGYAVMVLLGTLLLMLPVSTVTGTGASFADAVFTATSASCVTGLVSVDTGTYWSLFGQIVIIVMIQIGGLGFVTMATFLMIALKKRIGLRSKELMIESINSSSIGGILRLTKKILIGTLIFEGLGAMILTFSFARDMALGQAVWFGIFHSISAFCNAGFDIFGSYSSLTSYIGEPIVLVTVMLLVIIGGIGFLVWEDISLNGIRVKRYSFHTKLVLSVTAILIFGGALLFFVLERNASHKGLPLGEQIMASFFTSVSARTAGMNVIDTAKLSSGGQLLNVLLMFIGGSSGSTAGGIKTTTFAVLVIYALANVRGKNSCEVMGRRISDEDIKKAVTVTVINLLLAVLGVFIISANQVLPLGDVMLEVFSAIGTVGLSTGITRSLTTLSRCVITFLMYLGRVGSISFAAALIDKRPPKTVTAPAEKIIIG